MKKVTIYDSGNYSASSPPEGLIEFIAWANSLLASIPEENKPSAEISIESYDSYGSPSVSIEVSYRRELTKEEKQEEAANLNARALRQAQQELATLAALKAKYEASP